jgi:environmental stress-induced protein Ves
MASVTHVPLAAQPRVPWKNGLGTTREVAVSPLVDGRFTWRVSVASVTTSGPFSAFDGYERTIVLLSGDGFALDFAGAAPPRTLDRPLEPCVFAGEWRTTCRLVGGPVEDLNLMVDRARARGSVEVLRAAAALDLDAHAVVALALEGAVTARVDDRALVLAPGDALRWDEPRGRLAVEPEPGAALVLATVRLG